jgi:hypothetical protein
MGAAVFSNRRFGNVGFIIVLVWLKIYSPTVTVERLLPVCTSKTVASLNSRNPNYSSVLLIVTSYGKSQYNPQP